MKIKQFSSFSINETFNVERFYVTSKKIRNLGL